MLEVVLAGPPGGIPLFVHHGTPGAAAMFDPLVEIGAERGLRHVTCSRIPNTAARDDTRTAPWPTASPTFSPSPMRSAAERCLFGGGSGGGPHSIACAALLPDRVIAAASIASPAPLDAEGFDWDGGHGPGERRRAGDGAIQQRRVQGLPGPGGQESMVEDLGGRDRHRARTTSGSTRSIAARSAGACGELIVKEIGHALAPGVWGWFDDDHALFKNSGFELSEQHAAASRRLARGARPVRSRSRTASGWPPSRRRGAPAPERRAPVAQPRLVLARSSTGCWLT